MDYTPTRLRSDAAKCRDLATTAFTEEAREVLKGIADGYEQEAAVLEKAPPKKPRQPVFDWLRA